MNYSISTTICIDKIIPHICFFSIINMSKFNFINMKKNRKKQIVVLCIALVCIFILAFHFVLGRTIQGKKGTVIEAVLFVAEL